LRRNIYSMSRPFPEGGSYEKTLALVQPGFTVPKGSSCPLP
jgi:hypothetical protein